MTCWELWWYIGFVSRLESDILAFWTQFWSGRQQQYWCCFIVFPVFLEYYWFISIYVDCYYLLYDFEWWISNVLTPFGLCRRRWFPRGNADSCFSSFCYSLWCMPQEFVFSAKCRSWICWTWISITKVKKCGRPELRYSAHVICSYLLIWSLFPRYIHRAHF